MTGSFDKAMGELTKYRRKIRRRNKDNQRLAVIFNDYMNCLWGDPTAEKEFPLVDAAAEAGCEYFCIDAGWYADGFWWDEVGEWKESRKRFPNGVKEVADYIRKKGMIRLWTAFAMTVGSSHVTARESMTEAVISLISETRKSVPTLTR